MAGIIVFDPEDEFDFSGVALPCEFCNELFPSDVLPIHQSGCRPDIAHFSGKEHHLPSEETKAEFNFSAPDFGLIFGKEIENLKEEVKVKAKCIKVEECSQLVNDNQDYVENAENFISTESYVSKIYPAELKFLEENTSAQPKISDTLENDQNVALSNPEGETMSIRDISDDENDDGETVESFHRRAMVVLNRRLAFLKKGHKLKQNSLFA